MNLTCNEKSFRVTHSVYSYRQDLTEVRAGDILFIGQTLRSQDGNSSLVFQEDGDLVVSHFSRVVSSEMFRGVQKMAESMESNRMASGGVVKLSKNLT